ncbi:MAG: glycogen debranching protein GlgX [Sulfuricella sp.]|nr:glycogen debranching protein GlgX [Sulfuricella sp.]
MTLIRKTYLTHPGCRYPHGATPEDDGVNFSIYSRHATSAELLLYENGAAKTPFQIVRLDPETNHSFFNWHVKLLGLPVGTHYTWRLDGPSNTAAHGWRFDPAVELVDPWAREVDTRLWERRRTLRYGPSPHRSMRAVVTADRYDWEGDQHQRIQTQQMIIYELHVGGFTRHPSSGVAHPGTFSGVVEKIPYLQALGITHVELLPVMAFDESDVPPNVADLGLENYWGYSTHSFFAPHPGYGVNNSHARARDEFRDLVKALHQAGIGVILDVVFNHTAEGGIDGPALNFKGIGNETFYHLDPADRRRYRDYTGCGNTLNANHPFVAHFIIDCLEYWVEEMHVDGFRFDLASALARGEDGEPLPNPPVLWGIELSDTLAGAKIIAEAWDAAGLYQVGSFPGYRWMEWNGRYRDTLRRFVAGETGLTAELATRLSGSSDLYAGNLRHPINSVNFVTCHDGFTLWDLVSHHHKRNEINGEANQDGSNDNLSWNCGTEGPTDDPVILALRRRQAKNFMALLMLSQGVPMLLAGDEMLRTQHGNNNVWCQNNPLAWIDWTKAADNADMVRFVAGMIALRRRHPNLMRRNFLAGQRKAGETLPDIAWHGTQLDKPQWNAAYSRQLAFTLNGRTAEEPALHVMMNSGEEALEFELPQLGSGCWYRAADTFLASPDDILEPGVQPCVAADCYRVAPHSVVVLEFS